MRVVVAATGSFPTWVTVIGTYCQSTIWQDSLATMGEVYDLDVLNDSVMFMCGAIDPPDPLPLAQPLNQSMAVITGR